MTETKTLPQRKQRCAICERKVFARYWGPSEDSWGNSAWPVVNDGRCCDVCNWMIVIPARLAQLPAAAE
jgi:hypothetical protein